MDRMKPKPKKSKPTDSDELKILRQNASKALGVLIAFYRHIDGRSQNQLSADASLNPSEVASFEAGRRLPLPQALKRICEKLKLDAFQERQLQIIASFPNRASAVGHEWVVPDDVLEGVPIFLRKPELEHESQVKADISEMWIVTHKPMAQDGAMYDLLRKRLVNERTKFVYFISSHTGEDSFKSLWDRLIADVPSLESKLTLKLQCILSPPSLGLYHCAICDPGQLSRMFGRAILYQNASPVGFYAMDSTQVARAFELLDPVYKRCVAAVGNEVRTDSGVFRMLKPNSRS
jgi:transcriptional regulator with XRE-family HTH domain